MNKEKQKIFIIGLSRTGTTSMIAALRILGYRACHFPGWMLKLRNRRLYCDATSISQFDALADTPIARFYKTLDKKYTNAKFILTVRDIDKWLNSCEKFFFPGRFDDIPTYNQLHIDLYNSTDFNRKKFRHAYEKHIEDVFFYFRNRQRDLLIIDICSGEGWNKLCSFLNKPAPPPDPISVPQEWID